MAVEKKNNIFASYGKAAENREKEQKETEAVAKGKMRKRGANATTMTLSISMEDKMMVKEYAAQNATTVSDLLHTWINEFCKG